MINILKKKGFNISEQDKAQFINNLRNLSRNEQILLGGLRTIQQHVRLFKVRHKKNLAEIMKRLKEAETHKEKRILSNEHGIEKRTIEALDHLEKYENKTLEYKQRFDRLIATSLERIRQKNLQDTLTNLAQAKGTLQGMQEMHNRQKSLERYISKLNDRSMDNLKKEKNAG